VKFSIKNAMKKAAPWAAFVFVLWIAHRAIVYRETRLMAKISLIALALH
jgi:hypothetical protein